MIKISIETLLHFECQECKKWFSIADRKVQMPITCPNCGEVHRTAELRIPNKDLVEWVHELKEEMSNVAPVITLIPPRNTDESIK